MQNTLDRKFYPNATRFWDDERFSHLLRQQLNSETALLDLGAGRGKTEILDFRNCVARVVGVDVDEEVLKNPFLHESHVITPGARLPFDDSSFDVIYSCNVLEHVETPTQLFSEIRRILKPGGIFLSKTTNKYHYVALAARYTPLWFHKFYNKLRGREEEDTFPTVYLCNSKRQVESLASHAQLELEILEFWEWRPEYLRISIPTYLAGITYEKIVNSTNLLQQFRAVMVVGLTKKDDRCSK